jgi:cobalamin biosynthesis protein CobD/CbiB
VAASLIIAPLLTWVFSTVEWSVDATAFYLPPSVLNTLLATTTINVITLFLVVTYYLFPRDQQESRFESLRKKLSTLVGRATDEDDENSASPTSS